MTRTAPPSLDSERAWELIDALYGALEPDRGFSDFLVALEQAIAPAIAALVLQKPLPREPGLILCPSGDPEIGRAFSERYYTDNDFLDSPLDRVFTFRDQVPAEALEHNAYFRDYLRPNGLIDVIGLNLRLPGGTIARLRASRGEGQEPFGNDEKAVFEWLRPHFARAVSVHARIDQLLAKSSLHDELTGRLGIGEILFNREGRVLECNAVASELLAERDVLLLRADRLSARDERLNRELQSAVESALRADAQEAAPQLLYAERPDGDVLGLLIRRMPVSSHFDSDEQARAVAYVGDPRRRFDVTPALLEKLYGLTTAEARVAVRLAEGLSPDEVAETLHVSRNTVRTHLAHIFEKTGVHRQSGLVNLLAKTFAAVWPEPPEDPRRNHHADE